MRKWLAVGIASVLYGLAVIMWLQFVRRFAHYEVYADNRTTLGLFQGITYFQDCWQGLLTSGTALCAALGFVFSRKTQQNRNLLYFWVCWLASYTVFKLIMPTTSELRHFATALPALAGVAAGLCPNGSLLVSVPKKAGIAIAFLLAISLNLYLLIRESPCGVVGYAKVGQLLADCAEPGNILLCCWEDQELIFRYRSSKPVCDRYCIRSDRVLAIRVPEYAKQDPIELAKTEDDVLRVIKAGKIKYVVTCKPGQNNRDPRTKDMLLVEKTMLTKPISFRSLGEYPLTIDYAEHAYEGVGGLVCVWEYTDVVEEGKPDLPVVIPTAGIVFRP
jgi:hypothetical protein